MLIRNLISMFGAILIMTACGGGGDDLVGQDREALTTCSAGDIGTLKTCVANLASYDVISLTADITCTGDACCGADLGYDRALVQIISLTNKTIEGNGHTLTRQDRQRVCRAIFVAGTSSNIKIQNLTLDEYAADTDLEGKPCPSEADGESLCGGPNGCVLDSNSNTCIETVRLNAPATGVFMNNFAVYNAKATAVEVWNRSGTWMPVAFTFTNSVISNAGALGLVIGPSLTPTDIGAGSVSITNSTFTAIRANALAVVGLTGTSASQNTITSNTFYNNHTHGLWLCCEPGQTLPNCDACPGGQVYLGALNYTTFQANVVRDGICDNCLLNGSDRNPHSVDGIELGLSDAACGPNCVHHLSINNNVVRNIHRLGVYRNAGTTLDATTNVTNNSFINDLATMASSDALGLPGATTTPNTVIPIMTEYGFEADPNVPWVLEPNWTQGVVCGTLDMSTGTHAVRWCDTTDSTVHPLEGHCVLRMMTKTITSCQTSDIRGLWVRSPKVAIPSGRRIYLDTWSRNGGVWAGQVCLEWSSSSGASLGRNCVPLAYDTWVYNPDLELQVTPPTGTAFVNVRYVLTTSNGFADIDHTRLAW